MRASIMTGLRGEHVRLVGSYWVRFSLRTGGGLMALLIVLIAGLSIASVFISPVDNLMMASPGVGHTEGEALASVERLAESDQVVHVVRWVTGANESDATYFLRTNPALLSVILLVFLMAFPFIACIAGFNQTAGDISTGGLRYLLLRTERPNIFFGRFVGTIAFMAASTAVVVFFLGLYVGLKFRIYAAGEIVAWLAQGWVAILLVIVPYLALSAWMSAVIDSPFGALALSLLLAGFPIIFLKLVDLAIAGDQSWLQKLTPWGWKYDLLSGDVGTRLLAYVVMLGFTALFLALGARHFGARDL